MILWTYDCDSNLSSFALFVHTWRLFCLEKNVIFYEANSYQEDNSYQGVDDTHYSYGTEEAEFTTCTSSFYTDQVFWSREDMKNWVKNTAYSLGFVIVIKRSKQCKDGLMNKLVLICDRGGKPRICGSSTNTSSKKTDCPFKLVAKYSLEHGYWTIRVVCDQHNHLPTVNLEGHAYARRLFEDEHHLVEDLTSKNVPPHEILSTLKDQDETNLSTLPTIYEAQKKIRKNEKGAKTPMQFLMSVLQIHRYVYQPYTHPITNDLQALFFVHPTSYEIWRAFPYVLEDSPTWISYEENYKKLRTLLLKYPRIIRYVHENWLDKYKNHFVSASIDKCLNFGNCTTNRAESQHAKLKNYISLNNVKGDGNCGFWPVAVSLGRDENMRPLIRQELLQELRYHEHDYTEILTFRGFKFIWDTVNFSGTGFAPIDKWMSMPDTGLVIASFYRRPAVS
ncbi:FAR1-related sequence 5-like protein [Tanacetum coccineum]